MNLDVLCVMGPNAFVSRLRLLAGLYIRLSWLRHFQSPSSLAPAFFLRSSEGRAPGTRSLAMVTTTFEDVELNAAPSRIWAALKDGSNLFPKIVPDNVKSIELLEGDGGPGSVRLLTFGPAAAAAFGAPYVKEKVEFVDEAAKTMTVAAIEGGAIGQYFTAFKRTAAFKPGKDDSTTLCTISVDYEPIGEPSLEDIKSSLVGLMKAEEAFLQANADAYT